MAGQGVQNHGDHPFKEEDYIDMDLSSPAAVAARRSCLSREFEFHMSAPLDRREALASPADELFYKGKLLPLHLPPRLQMVEELLDQARADGSHCVLSVSTAPATPFGSCNASPANSCYVSGELNVEEYFQEFMVGLTSAEEEAAAVAAGERKPWSRKLRFIGQLNLGIKLKASKACLKAIFATKAEHPDGKNTKARELSNGGFRAWRKNPFGQIKSHRRIASQSNRSSSTTQHCHRRSFSSVIVRCSSSSNKTSSASSQSSYSSSSSAPSSEEPGAGPALRRSSSASSEVENPIQGAIAYCKKSQQLASVRKSASDAGFRFLSSTAAKIAAESECLEEPTEICRG